MYGWYVLGHVAYEWPQVGMIGPYEAASKTLVLACIVFGFFLSVLYLALAS